MPATTNFELLQSLLLFLLQLLLLQSLLFFFLLLFHSKLLKLFLPSLLNTKLLLAMFLESLFVFFFHLGDLACANNLFLHSLNELLEMILLLALELKLLLLYSQFIFQSGSIHVLTDYIL